MLTLHNRSGHRVHVHVADAYGRDRSVRIRKHTRKKVRLGLTASRWYDVLVTVAEQPHFRRALAGRFETGRDSTSDPQLGR